MNILAHIIKQHANLPLFSVQLLDEHELPIDLTTATSVTFRSQLVGDPSVIGGGACTIDEAAAGLVSYEFANSDTQISGTYLGTITIGWPSSKTQALPFSDYYLIVVEPDLVDDVDDPDVDLVFATVADARSMGYELTEERLLRAQGHIEVMCGRMLDAIQDAIDLEVISASDVSRLKKATVYQAVWIGSNDDVEERTDVTQIRTAGLSGESATLTADGITLAPLARRLLIGLSWVRSRSVRTTSRRTGGRMSLTTTNGPGWGSMNGWR
mgnify:FL=1